MRFSSSCPLVVLYEERYFEYTDCDPIVNNYYNYFKVYPCIPREYGNNRTNILIYDMLLHHSSNSLLLHKIPCPKARGRCTCIWCWMNERKRVDHVCEKFVKYCVFSYAFFRAVTSEQALNGLVSVWRHLEWSCTQAEDCAPAVGFRSMCSLARSQLLVVTCGTEC